MGHGAEHQACLAFVALVQDQRHARLALVLLQHTRLATRNMPVRQDHTLGQAPQRLFVGYTVDDGFVFFLHAATRVRDGVGPIAIIGQQQQPLGIAIEPAHREEALRPRHQPDGRGAALRVARRGQ